MAKETPDRILAASLKLFNQFGVSRVSVCQVADEIGISPGNLAYHFPSKKFILYSLVADLESRASEILGRTDEIEPGQPAQSAAYLVDQFYLMRRYRFLFDSIGYAAEIDVNIAESRQRIRNMVQKTSIKRLERAVANEDIRPIELPSSSKIIAENLWAVWVDQLCRSRRVPGDEDETRAAVLDCCFHHLSLIRPRADPRYVRGVQVATHELMAQEARVRTTA